MSFVQFILDLFYPPRCPFCNNLLVEKDTGSRETVPPQDHKIIITGWEGQLCRQCATKLPWLAGNCPRCAYPLAGEGEICTHCRGLKYVFDECVALGSYRGEIRQILHRFKYYGKKSLARSLGLLLAAKLSGMDWLNSVELLVPVPLSPQRLSQRGYNQAALLAAVIGKELRIPRREVLVRVKNTPSQTGLARNQRMDNLKGAFLCRERLPEGCHVLLLDDVFTSGATAGEAARALKEAGAGRVSVAVLAR